MQKWNYRITTHKIKYIVIQKTIKTIFHFSKLGLKVPKATIKFSKAKFEYCQYVQTKILQYSSHYFNTDG